MLDEGGKCLILRGEDSRGVSFLAVLEISGEQKSVLLI